MRVEQELERRVLRGRFGSGERGVGEGGFERGTFAGADLPTCGRDFDELARGVGEVEEDCLGAAIDAARDVDAAVVGIGGCQGFEVAENGGEGVGGGDGLKLAEGARE